MRARKREGEREKAREIERARDCGRPLLFKQERDRQIEKRREGETERDR